MQPTRRARSRQLLGPLLAAFASVAALAPAWVAGCGGSSPATADAGDAGSDVVEDDALSADVIFEVGLPDVPLPDGFTLDTGAPPGPDGAVTCMLLRCPGMCVDGRCLTVLATGGAYDLAVQGSRVYWTNAGTSPGTGSVVSLPTTPGQASVATLLATGQNTPSGIAVNATQAFWVDDSATAGAVLSVLLPTPGDAGAKDASADGGSAPAITTLAGGQASPVSIAIDDANVYWTTTGALTAANGTVASAPIGGGTPVTLASGRAAPSVIAIDATDVYWIDAGEAAGNGAVLRVPKTGGATTTLAVGQNYPGSIAVDATYVYWTELGAAMNTSAVVKLAKAGGTVATIAGGLGVLAGLTADGTNVYWAVGGGNGVGSIQRAPASGNVVTTLVTGLDFPFALTTDATTLYWTDDSDGSVSSLSPK